MKRILNDFVQLDQDPDFQVFKVDESNMHWIVYFNGPTNTDYENG